MEIEFGRNGDNGKLKILFAGKVSQKDMVVDAGVSREHCRLTISDNGEMTLCNLNPDNETFLNGVSINKRTFKLTNDTVVALGSKRFVLPLKEILKELGVKQTYSISHLKDIVANYKEEKMRMQISIGRQNAMRGLMPAFMALAGILGCTGILPDGARIIPSILSFAFACYFGYKGFVSASNNPRKQMELDKKYHEECVCPNPDCGHFLSGEYEDILKAGACPWCKSKFKE
jgi:hypothetical protein